MRFILVFILVLFSIFVKGQANINSMDSMPYFEDQFYMGVSYNFVLDLPSATNQRNLSYGLKGGFIKDIPLNKSGTKAIGIGAGLAINSYYTNLVANKTVNNIDYSIQDTVNRSKLETHLIEFPLEFRWRSSTSNDYKFWRAYAGVKAAYIAGARSKAVYNSSRDGFDNTDLTKLQYGLTFSFGYNTFNLHAYYSLSNLFDGNASVSGEVLRYRPLRIGLIFYIL